MTGPAPAETALAADGGAAAAPGVALITAGRYIQAHPGDPVPPSVQADAHRALDVYAGTRLAVAS